MKILISYLLVGVCWAPAFAAGGVKLPFAASTKIDFARDIQPLLRKHCAKCHSGETRKGGFSINTRKTILDGSEADVAVKVGDSANSPLIHRIAEADPDLRMPPKGQLALSKTEVGLLRAWVDQGMKWPDGFAFGKLYRQVAIEPRAVKLPEVAGATHPVDRLLQPYFVEHGVKSDQLVSDRVFARRVWLDLIGLLPPVGELEEFVNDKRPDKHARLVDRLLADKIAYAEHWMAWWSDLLRNDYRGTGYIDGGRKQLTGWLYRSLRDNKPYDRFVNELISGANGAEGFLWGIQWRGTVNDSQRREMQAAQSVSQVFLGTNLKCASCHDSFVNHWKLKQAYAFASVFAAKPLELHRCDKPTGKMSTVAFLYPQLGTIDAKANLAARLQQLSNIITSRKNGRLSRTVVNRLWSRFFGAGIVEPLDDMDQEPWNQDLLDWLANDLAENGYDIKRTIKLICTSRAYRLASVSPPQPTDKFAGFRGPVTKRLSAEQFTDAVFTLADAWPKANGGMLRRDGRGQGGQLAAIDGSVPPKSKKPPKVPDRIRCVFLDTDDLLKSLGRPIREQIVTRRESVATTLQCLELTNGRTLDSLLKTGSQKWLTDHKTSDALIGRLYLAALSRPPVNAEIAAAREFLGEKPTAADVQDLLWIVTMLPEFQLIR